eukprot:sb/3478581/
MKFHPLNFPLRGLSGTVKHSVCDAIASHVRRLYGTAPACPSAHICPNPDRIKNKFLRHYKLCIIKVVNKDLRYNQPKNSHFAPQEACSLSIYVPGEGT